MVGIAGEDDLDAPDIANEPPQRDKSAEVGVAPGSNLEPAPARSSQLRTTNPAAPRFAMLSRNHGLCSGKIDCIDLVGENGPQAGEPGPDRPMGRLSTARADQRFSTMKEDLRRRYFENSSGGSTLHCAPKLIVSQQERATIMYSVRIMASFDPATVRKPDQGGCR
jgi:hypothetical protein